MTDVIPAEVASTYARLLEHLPGGVLTWWNEESGLNVAWPFAHEWVAVRAPVDDASGEWVVEQVFELSHSEPLLQGVEYAVIAEALIYLENAGPGRAAVLEHLNTHLLKAGEVWRSLRRDHLEWRHEDHRPEALRCLCPGCRAGELLVASAARTEALARRDRYADLDQREVIR